MTRTLNELLAEVLRHTADETERMRGQRDAAELATTLHARFKLAASMAVTLAVDAPPSTEAEWASLEEAVRQAEMKFFADFEAGWDRAVYDTSGRGI